MNGLDYNFEEVEPEYPEAIVATPQIVAFNLDINTVKVVIYFMSNAALTITGGVASSAMGKVMLQYTAHSESGAYTASVNMRKKAWQQNSSSMDRKHNNSCDPQKLTQPSLPSRIHGVIHPAQACAEPSSGLQYT